MEYIQQIKRECEIRKRLDDWTDKRKELVYRVTDYYNTRGEKFAKDLEKLIAKYETAPKYTGVQIINELTKKI
jgi:hypothetical protein